LDAASLSRQEDHADGRGDIEVLAGRSQTARLLVDAEQDHVIGILVGCEQITTRRVDSNAAWDLPLGGDAFDERERALPGINREYCDAVMAAIRNIEEPAIGMDFRLGSIVRSGEILRQR
jgi:hypothetical protein